MLALWGEVPANYSYVDPIMLRHPILLGLSADSVVYGTLLFALYLLTFGLRRFVRESLRLRRGHCMQCGYDLRFDLAGGCPECGWRQLISE